jgi:predicted fused transcriptional regulator/phosphomethylpyrimidine kinase
MIREFKNVQGKNITFNTNELNKVYRKKVPEVERLKNLHIEYVLGSGKTGKEAIVLVMGHKP